MRLIDADVMIRDLKKLSAKQSKRYGQDDISVTMTNAIIADIEAIPTVEPQRMKGRWKLLPGRDDEHIRYLHCSVCHFNGDYESNFCPNCGAWMRGEQDD